MESVSPSALPSWRILSWIIAAFFGLTFAAYLIPMAGGIFVAWDDTYLIYFNPIIKGISWKTLHAAFTSYDPELYIPLTFLSYQLDYLVAGLNAFQYHFHNLILHTINALLVSWFLYLLMRREGSHSTGSGGTRTLAAGSGWVAILGGLLFAVHPLHTEAVAWASARKDVLSTLFLLLSLISYLHFRSTGTRKHYHLSLGLFFLGLLSKVTVLMLPLVLFLIDVREKRRWSVQMILEKIPFLELSILFGFVALFGKRDIVQASTFLDKILMACKSTIFYLEKLFVPTHLSVLYPYNGSISITSADFFVPVILLSIILILLIASLRWTREIFFGLFFFLLTLIPTFVNFAKGGELYFASDRYAYVPSIGILYLVALTASHFRHKRITIPVAGIVLTIFLILTFRQALVWRDSVALFTHTLRSYPRVMAAHLNLAMVYREMNELDKSMEQLKIADTIRPHSRTHVAFATLYEREGNRSKAIQEYKKAIMINPKDPEPYFGLGILYERDGKIDAALEQYRIVLSIDPKYVGTYNNLAGIYLKQGKLDEAKAEYEKAIEIDPYFPDGHFNLGLIAQDQGRTDDAIRSFERAVELDPKDALEPLEYLLKLYAKKNDLDRAVSAANRILAIDPSHPTAGGFLDTLRQRGML